MSTPRPQFEKPADSSRSPCPALNALANHGYIERSGKNISFFELVNALGQVYGLSRGFAMLLVSGAMIGCGRLSFSGAKLDLSSLLNPGIAHAAALVHDDPDATGHVVDKPDPRLLNQLLVLSKDKTGITLREFARARLEREAVLRQPLPWFPSHIAAGETALLLDIFGGKDQEVPVELLKQFLGEERLPDGWTQSSRQGFSKTMKAIGVVKKEMEVVASESGGGGGKAKTIPASAYCLFISFSLVLCYYIFRVSY